MILPHSFKLGRTGQEEPDGFVSVPDYRDIEDLADVGSFNFSYDAKYSEADDGYDFGAAERRQMIDYIGKFSRKRDVLGCKNTKYHAHVIISNNVQSKKLKTAASKMYGSDGLKGKAKKVRLVLMRKSLCWLFSTGFKTIQSRSCKSGFLSFRQLLNCLTVNPKKDIQN